MTSPGRAPLSLSFVACVVALASYASAETPESTDNGKADASAEQSLIALEQQWAKAETTRDAPALRRILDDKFVFTFGAGELLDKNGFIQAVTSGEPDPSESQALSERTTRVDGDTAVVVGTDTVRRTKNGKLLTSVYRYTTTYIKRRGRWLAFAEQIVKVPQIQ